MFTRLSTSGLQVMNELYLYANLRQCGGSVRVHVGGNTQETATLVASTPDSGALKMDYTGITNPVSAFFFT